MSNKIYSALDVARYVIGYSNAKKYLISNLKLQKLLYFIQADFLVTYDKPCFSECIEAWEYGPVVPAVYHKYKIYGSMSISLLIKSYSTIDIDIHDKNEIEKMIDECSKYSALQLVELTHAQSPWLDNYSEGQNKIIPNADIKIFFKEDKI